MFGTPPIYPETANVLKPRLKNRKGRVSINWSQLDAVIAGVSAIDLSSLAIRNRADAKHFVREYGLDLDSASERELAEKAHREAIAFVEKYFLSPAEAAFIADEVRNPADLLDLLVLCSNYTNKSNISQMWACAVLKVMHGIFHIDRDIKLRYFDEIRRQIFEGVDGMIEKEGAEHFLSDGEIRLPLFFFEKKRNKDRESILLKLLQKPSYVAEDIYDHLGIRLIFETKTECLFALKLLRRNHLISVTNVKPFRSRNSLVNLRSSRKVFNRYKPILTRTSDYPDQTLHKIDEEMDIAEMVDSNRDNPHSSDEYRSIQVTVRKMVRVENPAFDKVKTLLAEARKRGVRLDDAVDLGDIEREFSFYFDYEIQLLDRQSYVRTMHGPASHAEYKNRQRETARKRVLGPALRKYLAEQCPVEDSLGV